MKKAASISFALIVLLGSLNLGIAYHHCGGELAEAKLFYGNGHADCNMNCTNTPSPETDHNHHLNTVPCCVDDYAEFDQGDYTNSKAGYSFTNELKPFATQNTSGNITLLRGVFNNSKICSIPPPLSPEVSLPFIQVFII